MVIFVVISVFDVFNRQISQKLSQLGSLIDVIGNSSQKGFSRQNMIMKKSDISR